MEAVKQKRKPEWLKVEIGAGERFKSVRSQLRSGSLHTVCEEAKCPNIGECWDCGTATFMILGKTCTRNCLFCAVQTTKKGDALDAKEPEKIGNAIKRLGLSYTVLTSVDRDDLPDFGAGHFAQCIKAANIAGADVEALIPDFQGSLQCLKKVVEAKPKVIGHNIEVVKRLQGFARDGRASYDSSLRVLANVKKLNKKIFSKSSIMLGLGERKQEVEQAMLDLLAAGCDFLTLGQYLQPSKHNLPVQRFVKPEEFEDYKKTALRKGFRHVEAGPLVRSTYRAGQFFG